MEIYARWKLSWSKPMDEDNLIFHLSEMGKDIFCSIEKIHPGLYEYGNYPLENIQMQEIHICKNCFKKWKKLNGNS